MPLVQLLFILSILKIAIDLIRLIVMQFHNQVNVLPTSEQSVTLQMIDEV